MIAEAKVPADESLEQTGACSSCCPDSPPAPETAQLAACATIAHMVRIA